MNDFNLVDMNKPDLSGNTDAAVVSKKPVGCGSAT